MPFIKMHGTGNDYVYINAFEYDISDLKLEELVKHISHRHFGVGGDGLVIIMPSKLHEVRMRMFNPDGSESEMCGNAVRCVGGYCHNHGIVKRREFNVETMKGCIGIKILDDGMIRVDMGTPITNPREIPVDLDKEIVTDYPISVDGFEGKFTAVSMGNPHAVFFTRNIDSLDLEKIGPQLEHHELFPNRVNSEFIEIISPKEVNFRVWERGAGETWSCGTGASASIIAGNLTNRLGKKVLFHLKGGDLILETNEKIDRVWKTGHYNEVATGTYYYNET
ncbi:MAG: diaminopimelate epimerase [Candidatus Lokiarchaeota archaeon]|nr:diaminopimelate epimerase [Candidatus Lokiarchaeota archaeon]